MNEKQNMEYNFEWKEKENIIDNLEPLRSDIDKKVLVKSIKGINLSDILIMKNWLAYANLIGDKSYKEIYPNEIQNAYISELLRDQLSFRKSNQKN